jgi:site-specific recombinase XerD
VQIGNWLTAEQGKALLQASCLNTLRGKRDRAILAVLIGCGRRRAEVITIRLGDVQLREEHCVIADLIGKGRHVRTVPMPGWVKRAIDDWTATAEITEGNVFRRVNKQGRVWGNGITAKAIWHVVKAAAKRGGIPNLAPSGNWVPDGGSE